MAISISMTCLHCDRMKARADSHYCSETCKEEYMRRKIGPVVCEHCGVEHDTIREAKRAGFVEIVADPEGMSWNFMGVCKICAKVWLCQPSK